MDWPHPIEPELQRAYRYRAQDNLGASQTPAW